MADEQHLLESCRGARVAKWPGGFDQKCPVCLTARKWLPAVALATNFLFAAQEVVDGDLRWSFYEFVAMAPSKKRGLAPEMKISNRHASRHCAKIRCATPEADVGSQGRRAAAEWAKCWKGAAEDVCRRAWCGSICMLARQEGVCYLRFVLST